MNPFEVWESLSILQQANSRVPSAWAEIIKNESKLSKVTMVIDLVFGDGQRTRIATRPIRSTSSIDGGNHDAEPKLMDEPIISSFMRLSDSTSAVRSFSLAIASDVVEGGPSALISKGYTLAGHAEVSLQVDGQDHAHRLVVMMGKMSGGVPFGAQREVMEIEVTDPKLSSSPRIPPLLIDESFETARETAIGNPIPIVLGQYDGVPAIWFSSISPTTLPNFAFALGKGWSAPYVWVNGEAKFAGDAVYGYTVDSNDFYSYINFTNGGTIWSDSDTVYVNAVHDSDPESYTIMSAVQSLLEQYSNVNGRLSASLFGTARAREPKYPIRVMVNGSGASSTETIQYIESGLLKCFPMFKMIWDRGGYGPVYVDHRSRPSMTLSPGGSLLFDRVSSFQESPLEDLQNDFVLRYGYNPVLDSYSQVIQRNKENNALCLASVQKSGERPASEFECPYIFSSELATFVVDWMVSHLALPSYFVQYEGSASLYFMLVRGDTVELVEPDLCDSPAKAVVESIDYKRGRCVIGFRVWSPFWADEIGF